MTPIQVALATILWVQPAALGQLIHVADQESWVNLGLVNTPFKNPTLQDQAPVGQTFTPRLEHVGFVELRLQDNLPTNSTGAAIVVNLRSNVITGQVLGTTSPFHLPNGFAGVVTLYFTPPVPVIPGGTYCFEPVVLSGDPVGYTDGEFRYERGQGIYQGKASGVDDLWFHEGVAIPSDTLNVEWATSAAGPFRIQEGRFVNVEAGTITSYEQGTAVFYRLRLDGGSGVKVRIRKATKRQADFVLSYDIVSH